MSIFTNLYAVEQREIAGSRSSSRFQYQMSWGAVNILKLHDLKTDYVIGFEFHDDVLDLDDQDNPNHLNFYQVKTRSASASNWTIDSISKPEKAEDSDKNQKGKKSLVENKLSIVAKMYQHTLNDYGASSLDAYFVTNKHMNFSVDGTDPFTADQLEVKDKQTLKQRIAQQLKIPEANVDLKRLKFHQTDLSLEDTQTHLRGKILKFFTDRKLGGDKVDAWSKHLQAEIQRCNDYPANQIKNHDEFRRYKSISYTDVQTLLDIIHSSESAIHPMFKNILNPKLLAVGADVATLKQLQLNWDRVSVEILDINNSALQNLKSTIEAMLDSVTSTANLLNFCDAVYSKLSPKPDVNLFPEVYVKALILWCHCEKA